VRLADANQTVRLLLLLGFGNLSSNGPEEVNRYSTTILSALMSGMEDVNGKPELVMAAMDGLARVLGLVDAANVLSILVNICMKLKVYFETVRGTDTPQRLALSLLLTGRAYVVGRGGG
jgi:maestro heat-like repeat-containing protein family member 1